MADERDNEGGNPPKEGSPGTPPAIGEHMIPKQRLDEVIAQRNKLQAEAEARAETDRKATEKKAIEDGSSRR
ncbi:MAG: hypothetical protein IPF53_22760 [Blastocatellia bacterium]|nr:hypothetical protein [Blastocatellia bacterium]